jgi:hypothetical protein
MPKPYFQRFELARVDSGLQEKSGRKDLNKVPELYIGRGVRSERIEIGICVAEA